MTRSNHGFAAARLPGLDTLRALAVLLVVVFHLGGYLPPAFQPVAAVGWMGVDLFFVLSGYLIGTQLLKPYLRGERPRLLPFYQRRAYRILPAYFAVLAVYYAVPAWREWSGLAPAWKFVTFTENIAMPHPADRAFSHAWSLCVEEHFHLLLPWLVLLLMRKPSASKTLALMVAVFLMGLLFRAFEVFYVFKAQGLTQDDIDVLFMKYVYYSTWTRLDGLLCGVLLAAVQLFRPYWWSRVVRRGNCLVAGGALVTGCAVCLFHARYPDPARTTAILFGFPLLSLGLALLTAAATCERGLLTRPLPRAQMLATISFSLYLSHKGVAHLDRVLFPWLDGEQSWAAAAVYAASCLSFAAILYVLVERPFLLLRARRLHFAVPVPRPDNEARTNPAL